MHNAPEADLVIDTSAVLASRAQRVVKMLAEIDVVTKSLQTGDRTLPQCRDDIDVLLETVAEQWQQVESPLYQCMLGRKYTAPAASIILHLAFETGVVKL